MFYCFNPHLKLDLLVMGWLLTGGGVVFGVKIPGGGKKFIKTGWKFLTKKQKLEP